MYTRDEATALVEKVLDMAAPNAAEVVLTGGERSGTRWANSAITVNLVQYDRQLTVTVRLGQRTGTANTRDFSDEGLRAMVAEATANAERANESRNLPELLGPQQYIPVDAALPGMVDFGPAERARMVRESIDLADSKGVLGYGYMPKNDQTTCRANSAGLFSYYRSAEAGFVLTCRTPDGRGSGWAGITGIKDLSLIDPLALTRTASDKALLSRDAKPLPAGRYTVILEPRANARFLSLMTGIFNTGGGGGGGGDEPPAPSAAAAADGRGGGAPAAGQGAPAGRAGGGGGAGGAAPAAGQDALAGGGGGGGEGGGAAGYLADKRPGDRVFSDLFTLRSDVGNPVLRQTPIQGDNRPAAPVTWVENGILRNTAQGQPATLNMSLVMGGSDQSIQDIVATTQRGLLVTFFWYIRGVPATDQPLLNTGMTRDGLFLIENGEVVGAAQNFRWNMSPLVGYNNLTAVGRPVPMHMGESYDGGNTGLIPPVRIEEFYMTSPSPATE